MRRARGAGAGGGSSGTADEDECLERGRSEAVGVSDIGGVRERHRRRKNRDWLLLGERGQAQPERPLTNSCSLFASMLEPATRG